jgi:hypothetical protein
MAADAASHPRPRWPTKTDVCRLCVAHTRTRGHDLKTSYSNALLEIRV